MDNTTNTSSNERFDKPIINPSAAVAWLCILGFVIILLNIAALVITYTSGKRKHSINYPLIWLCVANILIGLFPLPIYGVKKYGFDSLEVTGALCDAWRYTYFTTIHLAMVSLMIMTFDKIMLLSFPLHYHEYLNKVKINVLLALSWIFFIIFDMIPFFPVSEYDDEMCHYVIKEKWALSMNILTMAIPLPVIITCYSYMIVLAYRQAVHIKRHNSVHEGRKKSRIANIKLAVEVKATRSVAFIVGSYILCWTPGTIYYLLVWLCKSCYPKNYEPHKTWIRFFFKILVMFHGCLTPLIFCWYSKIFRKEAKRFVSRMASERTELNDNSHVKTRRGSRYNSISVKFGTVESNLSEPHSPTANGELDSENIPIRNNFDSKETEKYASDKDCNDVSV